MCPFGLHSILRLITTPETPPLMMHYAFMSLAVNISIILVNPLVL